MAIPDYQSLLLPILKITADGGEWGIRDLNDRVAEQLAITPADKLELLPSGRQPVWENRIGWARTYLKKARLLDSPRRAVVQISERGRELLSTDPTELTAKMLRRYPEFVAFQTPARSTTDSELTELNLEPSSKTPRELLDESYETLRRSLSEELLQRVKESSPRFFERLVVELLVKMGYGGSLKDAGEAVGRSGDEGIDGIIKEDKLGLDTIYIQAKRWEACVGRPEIQKFVGALQGQRARKGVFITTSYFSSEARDYAARVDSKVILIDGAELSELMLDHGVGNTVVETYEIRRLDEDYFGEG